MYYRREALCKWKQKRGDEATYLNLITAFKKAGHHDYADFVHNIKGSFEKLMCHSIQIYNYYVEIDTDIPPTIPTIHSRIQVQKHQRSRYTCIIQY